MSSGGEYYILHPTLFQRTSHLLRRTAPLFLASLLALLLSLFAYNTWAENSSDRLMRFCLPFSIKNISQKAHSTLVCNQFGAAGSGVDMASSSNGNSQPAGSLSSGSGGKLADFLQSQKEAFLGDLKAGRGNGWVLAMGNEAGDLDTLASSIAYATLSSQLLATRTLPLILTPSNLLSLRPENILALNRSLLPPTVFLHQNELPIPSSELAGAGVQFALVDHNTLLPDFRAKDEGTHAIPDPVAAIIDHHDDEGNHRSASPRIIKFPTGSSASLVTNYFLPQWESSLSGPSGAAGSPVPQELATLLISAILIDTGGLKPGPGSKTQADDRTAAAFLWPSSKLGQQGVSISSEGEGEVTPETLEQGDVPASLSGWKDKLLTAKFDVQGLTTKELLLRDYKEYDLHTGTSSYTGGSNDTLKVGLSTVPYGLHDWLDREIPGDGIGWEGFMSGVDAWMDEQDLDVEGILTTFRQPAKKGEGKAKGRREIVLVVRTRDGEDQTSKKAVFDALVGGMEDAEVLGLREWSPKKDKGDVEALTNGKEGRFGAVWRQGNTDATRKQVAPLVKEIIGGIEERSKL